jgi:tetraacyldisaccharide 4'-kinase
VITSDALAGRVARTIWSGSSGWAALVRGALLVPAAGYRLGTAIRNAAYDTGVLSSRGLPAPSVGVGNLAIGGTGKTPLVTYLARELERRGCRVGVLLRGYGGDEVAEYREGLPGAVVVADADRHRGAARALAEGADALLLDDCLQRRDVRPDLLLAVVAAETWERVRWPMPAGPWREGIDALRRADAVVVSRKSAAPAVAADLAATLAPRSRQSLGLVADLQIAHLRPLMGGAEVQPGSLRGQRVVAVCGIGEPRAFAAQLAALGVLEVALLAHGDHHHYVPRDVDEALRMAGSDGVVVTTGKDAVKLRALWPRGAAACQVAGLAVKISGNEDRLARLLDQLSAARHITNPVAARPPARTR